MTSGTPGFVDDFVAFHWRRFDAWSPRASGNSSLASGRRTSRSGCRRSWGTTSLARSVQDRFAGSRCSFTAAGYGTEMRAAILELAFHGGLGRRGRTLLARGAEASLRISRSWAMSRTVRIWIEVAASVDSTARCGCTRDRWTDHERISVRISGLEPCFPLFGLNGPPEPGCPRVDAHEFGSAAATLIKGAAAKACACVRPGRYLRKPVSTGARI